MSESNRKAVALSGMEARLQAMRKDIALAEERVISFGCALSNDTFDVAFKRSDIGGKFLVERVTKSGASGGAGGLFKKAAVAPAATYSWSEFSMSGFACPGCGDRGSRTHCECGRLMCGANARDVGGQRRFACHPSCGESFFGVPATSVAATTGSQKPSLPPPNKKRALEAPRLRLKGPSFR